MTAAQRKSVDDFIAHITSIIRDEMSWTKIEPQYVDLYSSTLSDVEIDAAIAFYKTPTGASLIAKQPELIAKSQALSQEHMAQIQPKLMVALQDFIKQAAASAPAKP